MAYIILITICFLIDEVLTVIFSNSYLVNDLLSTPNLGFCAMVLTIRKFSSLDSCLFTLGYGMIYDFCSVNTFLLYAIIYIVIACLLQLWSKYMAEMSIESLVLCIVIIFVKDPLIYCYMNF